MDWMIVWTAVGAVATSILAVGIVFVFLQVRQAKRGTHAQLAVSLFKELRDKNILDTFREIYRLKPNDIRRLLTSTEKKDVKLACSIEGVLDKFELLGALVAQGIIDERIAIESYGGPPVLRCLYQLGENYIKEIRKQRGLFSKYVEDFAKRTVKYQIKHAPKDEWIHFLKEIPLKRSEDRINLIEELKDKLLSSWELRWAKLIRRLRSICKPALRERQGEKRVTAGNIGEV